MDKRTLQLVGGAAAVAGLAFGVYHRKTIVRGVQHFLMRQVLKNYTVQIVSDPNLLSEACIKIMKNKNVIGFDMEWYMGGKVAIMQVCLEKEIWIFQIFQINQIPKELAELLQSPNVIKCGVGILGDKKKVYGDFQIVMDGVLPIENLTKNSETSKTGLKTLGKELLHYPIVQKDPIVRSDWTKKDLSRQQREYAAIDALLSYEVVYYYYNKSSKEVSFFDFAAQCSKLTVSSPRLASPRLGSELGSPREKGSPMHKGSPMKEKGSPMKDKGSPHLSVPRSPSAQREGVFKAPTRTKDLYENCQLLSPDEVLLCNCDEKKINWYVSRGLATLILETPIKVAKLTFTPGGLGRSGSDFYLEEKQNICVSCGESDMTKLVKFSIVPTQYRKAFPLELKSHKCHDIVLLCLVCMKTLEAPYEQHRRHLAEVYDAPIHVRTEHTVERKMQEMLQRKMSNYSKLLLQAPRELLHDSEYYDITVPDPPGDSDCKHQIPASNINLMLKFIAESLGKSKVTYEEVLELSNKEVQKSSDGIAPHAELVVRSLTTMSEIHEFNVEWRKVFVNALQPHHLPQYWSVDYEEEVFEVNPPGQGKRKKGKHTPNPTISISDPDPQPVGQAQPNLHEEAHVDVAAPSAPPSETV